MRQITVLGAPQYAYYLHTDPFVQTMSGYSDEVGMGRVVCTYVVVGCGLYLERITSE